MSDDIRKKSLAYIAAFLLGGLFIALHVRSTLDSNPQAICGKYYEKK